MRRRGVMIDTRGNFSFFAEPAGAKPGSGCVVSKEAINSVFYIERLAEQTIGEIRHKFYYGNVSSLGNLLRRKVFKDCTVYTNGYTTDTDKNVDDERLMFNSDFIMNIRTVWLRGGIMGHSISIITSSEVVLNKMKKIVESAITVTKPVESKGNINVLLEDDGELLLRAIDNREEFIPENYPAAFADSREKMIELLKGTKGVFLLHSDPGCGKTTFIKTLPSDIKDKKFIFIPPAFGNILTEPSFLTFMMGQQNSVLVIEDAEAILRSRKGGDNHAVSNILNLTDGILSELLNIQVICTLNCNVKQIDEAIRRPGRLMWEQEFSKLSVDEANARLLSLFPEEGYVTKKPLSIAEIYAFGNVNSNVAEHISLGLVNR